MKENRGKESFLKLAKPAQRALANAGITSLKQVAKFSEEELLQLHGIGKNAVRQLRQALAGQELSLKKKVSS